MKQFIKSLLLAVVTLLSHNLLVAANPWVARHNLTPAQYQTEFTTWSQQGYRPISLSGYTKNGQEMYAVVFEKKAGVAWAARHGLSAAQYQTEFNTLTQQGYRPTIISGYAVGGQTKFAVVFEQKTGSEWVARHNLTAAQYQQTFDEYTQKGYYPAYINGYVVNGQELFACVFEKGNNPAWVARHNLTAAQYQTAFTDFTGQGYYPKVVSGYNKNGADLYAVVFIKPSSAPWASRHGVAGSAYQGLFSNMYFQGYRPLYVNAFASGTAEKFNVLWENTNVNVNEISKLDAEINKYRTDQNISALSLAICKDGRLVFAKGYGVANASTGEDVSPQSTMRIMSVSKPVTATGIMLLVQQNKLDLGKKVFGPDGILNAKYPTTSENLKKITVRQMLNHTSGLETCNGQPVFWDKNGTVKDAMDVLMKDANIFKYTPGSAELQWYYSNTGYYFLGRIIEEVSGQSYENFIRTQVLNPCGIGNTMYLGNADGTPKAGEALYVPESKPNMQLWGAFGGWVARPIDLLKFLVRVDGSPTKPDIITGATHTTMTTGSSLNMNYALGWSVSGTTQNHNGTHGSSRSFLVEMGNGISYAIIISNKPTDDNWCSKLRNAMETGLGNFTSFPSYDLFD
ncbi:MAG: serine hydrolase [Saprospiraceae bacterium]|nr:serine hydrolase [Saprospiraceae bacterium]